jgi:hypothetical protein
MNKILWTPEKIDELRKANEPFKDYANKIVPYGVSKIRIIAFAMGMTYNQINSALRRFCKEGK